MGLLLPGSCAIVKPEGVPTNGAAPFEVRKLLRRSFGDVLDGVISSFYGNHKRGFYFRLLRSARSTASRMMLTSSAQNAITSAKLIPTTSFCEEATPSAVSSIPSRLHSSKSYCSISYRIPQDFSQQSRILLTNLLLLGYNSSREMLRRGEYAQGPPGREPSLWWKKARRAGRNMASEQER